MFRVYFILLFAPVFSFAYFETTKTGDKPREMNGIFYDQFKDFTKSWHLISVRYRQDSGEQRFTYANDLAWKAMQTLRPNYPDGAMFGKVAFMTENDPAFPSSRVPSGAKRVQFMLKNRKAYASSRGWGYALFDADGNLFNEDMKAKTASCVACHDLVPDRDFVFSRQMQLHYDSVLPQLQGLDQAKLQTMLPFSQTKVTEVPKSASAHLKGFDYVKSLGGDLQKNAFSGTLDEIIPLLTEKAKLTGTPTALIVDANNFSLVVPAGKKCKNQPQLFSFHVYVQFNAKPVRNSETCL